MRDEDQQAIKRQAYALPLMIRGGEILVLCPGPGCGAAPAWGLGRALTVALFVVALLLVIFASAATAGVPVKAPRGYTDFCRRHPGDCLGATTIAQKIRLTANSMAKLDRVQREVTEKIFYVSDANNYGQRDYWNYPYLYGDCEDYALAKRKRLIAFGWPRSALLLDMVRMANGNTHLVLDVITDNGDIVLDNLFKDPARWGKLNYRRLMRQSRYVESAWLAPEPSRTTDKEQGR